MFDRFIVETRHGESLLFVYKPGGFMTKFKNTYRIESTRLKDWDYSIPWWYYVTINTKNHVDSFGRIENGKMVLNEFGKIAEEEWFATKKLRKNVELDYYIIMPNHIHGIIIINGSELETHQVDAHLAETHRIDANPVETHPEEIHRIDAGPVETHRVRLTKEEQKPDAFDASVRIIKNCLSDIIRGFKSAVTKRIHEMGYQNFSWQPRFYDRIIRNEKELYNVRNYIERNPIKWELKKINPKISSI